MKRLLSIMLISILLLSLAPLVSAEETMSRPAKLLDIKHVNDEYRADVVSLNKYFREHAKLFQTEEAVLNRCKRGKADAEFCENYVRALEQKLPMQLQRTAEGYVLQFAELSESAANLNLQEERKVQVLDNLAEIENRYATYAEKVDDAKNLGLVYVIGKKLNHDAMKVVKALGAEKFIAKLGRQAVKTEVTKKKLGKFIGEKEEAGEIDSEIINDYDAFVESRERARVSFNHAKGKFDEGTSNVAEGNTKEGKEAYKESKLALKVSLNNAKDAQDSLKETTKGIKEDFF